MHKKSKRIVALLLLAALMIGIVPSVMAVSATGVPEESVAETTDEEATESAPQISPPVQSEAPAETVETIDEDLTRTAIATIATATGIMGKSTCVAFSEYDSPYWYCNRYYEDGIGWNILIRMELLQPLEEYFQNTAPSEEEVAQLGIELCRALEVCSAYKIIHRDIKPENIFVNDLGNFKLGDFGVARTVDKTTGNMSTKGTYTYMAPEVYNEEPYSTTADIYSLGIVLYRYLNNRRTPFLPAYPAPIKYSDVEQARIMRMRGDQIPAPVCGNDALKKVILKAIAYNPKERFSTASEFREALQEAMEEKTVGIWNQPQNVEVTQDAESLSPTIQTDKSSDETLYVPKPVDDIDKPYRVTGHGNSDRKSAVIVVVLSIAAILLGIILCFLLRQSGGTGGAGSSDLEEVSESTAITSAPSTEPTVGTDDTLAVEMIEDTNPEQEIITAFYNTYAVYHEWLQGRRGSLEPVSGTDETTGVSVHDGATWKEMLSKVFASRYVIACMSFLDVMETDETLLLPARTTIDVDYDLTQMNPTIDVLEMTADTCRLFVSWDDSSGRHHEYYVNGLRHDDSWVFDDLTPEVSDGGYGLFGSHRETATPSPTPTPEENTTVISYKYIANLSTYCRFRSAPIEDDSNVIGKLFLGMKVGFIETSNEVFSKVEYDGTVGYVMSKYLSDTQPDLGNTTVVAERYIADTSETVYFRNSPVVDTENVVFTLRAGTKVGFIESANSDFDKVEYNGYYGYVLKRHLTVFSSAEIEANTSEYASGEEYYGTYGAHFYIPEGFETFFWDEGIYSFYNATLDMTIEVEETPFFMLSPNPQAYMEECYEYWSSDDFVTYSVQTDKWFSVSGYWNEGTAIYYRKAINGDDSVMYTFTMDYPAANRGRCDQIVEDFETTFSVP